MGNTIAHDFVLDNNCQHGKRVVMGGKKQKTENRESWRVSIPNELGQRAKLVAQSERRTLSNLLRYALEKYIEKKEPA